MHSVKDDTPQVEVKSGGISLSLFVLCADKLDRSIMVFSAQIPDPRNYPLWNIPLTLFLLPVRSFPTCCAIQCDLSERDNGILKKSARISFQCSESPKLSFSLSSHFSFLKQYQASALETSNPSQPHHNLEQTLLFFHIILESSVSISSLFLVPFKMHFLFSFIISLISASALEFRDLPSLHMAMPSSTSHVSSESEKDFHGPMPAIGQDPQGSSRELRPGAPLTILLLILRGVRYLPLRLDNTPWQLRLLSFQHLLQLCSDRWPPYSLGRSSLS